MKRCGRSVKVSVSVMLAGVICGGYVNDARAQWPTDYASPIVLSSGLNLRGASVVTGIDDDAVVAFVKGGGVAQRLGLQRYDGAGVPEYSGNTLVDQPQPMSRVELIRKTGSDDYFLAASMDQPELVDGINYYLCVTQSISGATGSYSYANYKQDTRFLGGVSSVNGVLHNLGFDFKAGMLSASPLVPNNTASQPIVYGMPRDMSIVAASTAKSLFAFTKMGLYSMTPSKVYVGSYDQSNNVLSVPELVADQGPEVQSDSQVTDLGDYSFMITWLGNLNDVRHLYVKRIDGDMVKLAGARPVMPDVISYRCAESNLGNPVFAAVTRLSDGVEAVDTVIAGIVDPNTGFNLSIPLATGMNAKVKYLHQEINGDFSVAYSVLENGTNLLKALRISGTTAGVLWQTTVADLGVASDEFIEEFPNTWVSSTSGGALYVVSRKDKPYSGSTSINMVRVRNDGVLGSDDLQKPTEFQTESVTAPAVTLAWTDNSNSETNYLVGRTTTDFSGIEIVGTLSANTTLFNDTTALPGVTYTYYVAAYQSNTGNFALSDPLLVDVM